MKLRLVLTLASLLLSPFANAAEVPQETQSSDLANVVGQELLTLSKLGVVSAQDFDGPMLWLNAKLAHVEVPIGKGGAAGKGFETQYVPTDSGIVLQFYGPYVLGETQKVWGTVDDKAGRTFEVLVELPARKFIGIIGAYGASFPRHAVDDLMSVGRVLPENRREK